MDDSQFAEIYDFGGRKPSDLGKAQKVKAGKYHCWVKTVAMSTVGKEKKSVLKLTFKIVNGTDVECAAKQPLLTESIFMDDQARKEFFGIALGMINPETDAGKQMKYNWKSVEGKHCIVEVEEVDYTGADGTSGKRSQVTKRGIWKLDDPKVMDVPLNIKYLQDIGLPVPPRGKPPETAPDKGDTIFGDS
jgi:hypothetical protein